MQPWIAVRSLVFACNDPSQWVKSAFPAPRRVSTVRARQASGITTRPTWVLMVMVMVEQWVMFLYSRCIGLVCLGRGMSCSSVACVDSVIITTLTDQNQIGEAEINGECYGAWCQTCPECACFEQDVVSSRMDWQYCGTPLGYPMTSKAGTIGWPPLTRQIRYIAQQPYDEEVHGQAISALGFVVCNQLRQLVLRTAVSIMIQTGNGRPKEGKAASSVDAHQKTYPGRQADTSKHPRECLAHIGRLEKGFHLATRIRKPASSRAVDGGKNGTLNGQPNVVCLYSRPGRALLKCRNGRRLASRKQSMSVSCFVEHTGRISRTRAGQRIARSLEVTVAK